MRMPALAGLPRQEVQAGRTSGYPPATDGQTIGNSLPPNTGIFIPPDPGPPGPTGLGQSPIGGNPAGNAGISGADVRAAKIINPYFLPRQRYPEGEGGGLDSSTVGTPTWWRNGIEGFNDQLRVVDRHAYYDTGNQTTGLQGFPPAGSPNTYNDPLNHPPRPDLRTVNRTVSHQIGSDATRNQNDLSRPFTRNAQGMYVGEQGSGYSPIYGGTPGLFMPYGTRGGVPYPIKSPVQLGQPGDGPQKVWAGPPHGLHSLTYPDRGDTLARYTAFPQMRPVRFDRPSNSPQAGQSYSQTVQMQGGRAYGSGIVRSADVAAFAGRGWLGTIG